MFLIPLEHIIIKETVRIIRKKKDIITECDKDFIIPIIIIHLYFVFF